VWRSTETSPSPRPTKLKYRNDVKVPQDPRSQWPKLVRHRNVTSRPARLGPSPTSTTGTALISLPPCPTNTTPEALKNLHRTFSCSLCTAMRFTQWAFALSSLAGACEAFRFTVWLGDKCTITGAGTKPSDQELLVIPQAVGDKGCMVRLFAEPRSVHTQVDKPCPTSEVRVDGVRLRPIPPYPPRGR
jgi:hypothetical protein